jgi:hypothetical protein
MTRILLKSIVLFVLLFVSMVGLIRAQPYDDGDLRAFLFADTCTVPCFMGIQPGVTTTQEAYNLLARHPWVADVTAHYWFSGPRSSLFSWSWSGQQPTLINATAPGIFSTEDNIVDIIQVPTTITLGAMWLYKQPEIGMIATEPGEMSYSAIYFQGALEVKTVMLCPLQVGTFWQSQAQIQLDIHSGVEPGAFELPGWFRDSRCP